MKLSNLIHNRKTKWSHETKTISLHFRGIKEIAYRLHCRIPLQVKSWCLLILSDISPIGNASVIRSLCSEIIYSPVYSCILFRRYMFDKLQCMLTISIFTEAIPSIGRQIYLRTAPITISVVYKSYMNIFNVAHDSLVRISSDATNVFFSILYSFSFSW